MQENGDCNARFLGTAKDCFWTSVSSLILDLFFVGICSLTSLSGWQAMPAMLSGKPSVILSQISMSCYSLLYLALIQYFSSLNTLRQSAECWMHCCKFSYLHWEPFTFRVEVLNSCKVIIWKCFSPKNFYRLWAFLSAKIFLIKFKTSAWLPWTSEASGKWKVTLGGRKAFKGHLFLKSSLF